MKVEYNGNGYGYKAEMGGMISNVNINGVGANAPDNRWLVRLRNGVVLSVVSLIFSLSSLILFFIGLIAKDWIVMIGLTSLLTVYGIADIVMLIVSAVSTVISFVLTYKNKKFSSNVKAIGFTVNLISLAIVIVIAIMVPGTFLI